MIAPAARALLLIRPQLNSRVRPPPDSMALPLFPLTTCYFRSSRQGRSPRACSPLAPGGRHLLPSRWSILSDGGTRCRAARSERPSLDRRIPQLTRFGSATTRPRNARCSTMGRSRSLCSPGVGSRFVARWMIASRRQQHLYLDDARRVPVASGRSSAWDSASAKRDSAVASRVSIAQAVREWRPHTTNHFASV